MDNNIGYPEWWFHDIESSTSSYAIAKAMETPTLKHIERRRECIEDILEQYASAFDFSVLLILWALMMEQYADSEFPWRVDGSDWEP